MAVFPCSYKNCINPPRRNGLSNTDSLSRPYLTSSTAVVGDCQRNQSVPLWLITVLISFFPFLLLKKKKSENSKPNDPSYQLQKHFRTFFTKALIPWQKYIDIQCQRLNRYWEFVLHIRFWPALVFCILLHYTANMQ